MASNPSYSDYPTSQADGGVSGKCAKLTTISTGELGKMFGAPIAAGNLFLGSFEVNMVDMPASTHFGIPLRNTAPVSLTGYILIWASAIASDIAGTHKNIACSRSASRERGQAIFFGVVR